MSRAADPRLAAAAAALRQQRYAEAESLARAILAERPAAPRALALLAQVRAELGDDAEALALLERGRDAHPRDPAFAIALAQRHAAAGRFAEAHAAADAALALAPDAAPALAAKATLLEREGDRAALRAMLEPRVAGPDPDPALAAPLLRALVDEGDLDAAIALGRRAAPPQAPTGTALRDLLFSLARALERRDAEGDRAAAVAAARRGNAIHRPPFDDDAWDRLYAEVERVCSAARYPELARSDLEDDSAVFVVGLPRCGSTLVERILAAHPRVHGAGEIPAMHRTIAALPGRIASRRPWPACLDDLDAATARSAGRDYLEAIAALAPDGTDAMRVVNKDLGNALHLGAIGLLLPRARAILVTRDSLDQGLACWMERLRPSAAPWATDLRRIGRHLRRHDRLMRHWLALRPIEVIEVRYEALVTDPERESRRLIDFLGLPWDDACLRFHATERIDRTLSHAQVRAPVHRGSIGRGAGFRPWLGPLIETIGADRIAPPDDDDADGKERT